MLYKAFADENWPWVSEIIEVTGNCKPSQAAVDAVLFKANTLNQWLLIQEILEMTGDNKPSSQLVGFVLQHHAVEDRQFPLIQKILHMTGDNKPGQVTVNIVLSQLVNHQQWPLVEEILNMTGDNQPGDHARQYALEELRRHQPQVENEEEKCLRMVLREHGKLYENDQNRFYGFFYLFRRTKIDYSSHDLSIIIRHAVENNNRTRKVFINLGWMDEKGGLTEAAPQPVRDHYSRPLSVEENQPGIIR